MSKKIKVTVGVAVIFLIVGAGVLPPFIRARSTPAMNACVNNLRQLDGAKQQWVAENHKTTNDIPTWEDLLPYLRQKPVCPKAGTYILGRVGAPPRCSFGRTHNLSQ
jgi:hypothetical protein